MTEYFNTIMLVNGQEYRVMMKRMVGNNSVLQYMALWKAIAAIPAFIRVMPKTFIFKKDNNEL